MFNEPHMHLLVNHAPVVGFAIALLFALVCLFSRELSLHRALYWLVLGSALAMAAAYLTGEPAEHFVIDAELPVSQAHLSAHLRWSQWAYFSALGTGFIALLSLIALARRERTLYFPAALTFLLLLGVNLVGAVTAGLGGAVRHTEIHGDGFSDLLEDVALIEMEREMLQDSELEYPVPDFTSEEPE